MTPRNFKQGFRVALAVLLAMAGGGTTHAQTALGTGFSYQGQLNESGAPADGQYDMRFRLYNALTGGGQVGPVLTFDGTFPNPPPVTVVNGLFLVTLDFGAGIFAGDARWLAIEIRAHGSGFAYTLLSPRQSVTATPYALYALNSPAGGGLTLPYSGTFNGTDQTAFQLTHTGTGPAAAFRINNASSYYETITTTSNGTGPAFYATHSGTGYAGQFQNLNAANNKPALFATTNGTGAAVNGMATGDGYGVTGSASGVGNGVQGSASGTGNAIQGKATGNAARAGYFEIASATSSINAVEIRSAGSSNSQALYVLHTGFGDCGLFEINNAGSTAEAVEATTNGTGDAVQAFNTGTGRAGYFETNNATSVNATLYATASSKAFAVGYFAITNSANTGDAIQATTAGLGNAGRFAITNATNSDHALYVLTSGTGRAALFQQNNFGNTSPAVQISQSGNGVGLYATSNGSGAAIHGEAGGTGPGVHATSQGFSPALLVDGVARVDILEITGADVAEKFPVTEAVEPGLVVAIDAANPGKLCLARGAYNRRVAGVVSGANGLRAGTILGHLPGHEKENAPPIALTGRVWVRCDATENAIEPGDLLTTADLPGHAMKATDYGRAQGAIIGKAMTGLEKGRPGLVLVLVNLQ